MQIHVVLSPVIAVNIGFTSGQLRMVYSFSHRSFLLLIGNKFLFFDISFDYLVTLILWLHFGCFVKSIPSSILFSDCLILVLLTSMVSKNNFKVEAETVKNGHG